MALRRGKDLPPRSLLSRLALEICLVEASDRVPDVRLVVDRQVLATVAVDTAGAPALGGPRIVDLRLERARALMDEIAAGVRSRQSNDRGELHAS